MFFCIIEQGLHRTTTDKFEKRTLCSDSALSYRMFNYFLSNCLCSEEWLVSWLWIAESESHHQTTVGETWSVTHGCVTTLGVFLALFLFAVFVMFMRQLPVPSVTQLALTTLMLTNGTKLEDWFIIFTSFKVAAPTNPQHSALTESELAHHRFVKKT